MSYEIDFSLATSEQLEKVLCERVEQIRLSRNITQKMLAKEAGISLRTINRMAKGEGVSLDTFIRVLMALEIQENLKSLLPDPSVRPIERALTAGRVRKRAYPSDKEQNNVPWSWSE